MKAQQALTEHNTELFFHRIKKAGHIRLSGIGDMILLDEDASATTDAAVCRMGTQDWMFWLEQEAKWERPVLEGNVVMECRASGVRLIQARYSRDFTTGLRDCHDSGGKLPAGR